MSGFDLRDVLRGLRCDRSYAATVVATLAVAIGATTAIFSIVDGVMLKPLAYRESHRLVALRETWREIGDRIPVLGTNERHFNYWRDHAASFASMAQYRIVPENLTGAGEAAEILVGRASGTLFDVLQVQAAVGRTLTLEDERQGSRDVAVIADSLWRDRFGAASDAIGRAMTLDGKPYEIVGILPPSFRLPVERAGPRVDAFVALRVDVGWIGDHNDEAIGRLRAGATPDAARAELDVLQRQVADIATKEAHEPVTLGAVVTPLVEVVVGRARRGLLLLLAAIGAVLLIACSNLANLSLTRTLGRLRDAAVRSALGASRARLVARAIFEQVVLAAAGGAIGLGVAWAALKLFVRTAPIDLPRADEVMLDARVVAFAAAASTAAGVIVAILPAWRLAAGDVQGHLRAGALGATFDRGGVRVRSALLSIQIALSVALLIVTGLLGVSFVRLLGVDRGFTADRVLAVDIAMPASRYADEPVRRAAYDRLMAAVHAVPGVVSATTTSMLPLRGGGQVNSIVPEGSTTLRSEHPSANYRFVAPEYFRTLQLRIVRGRAFTDRERDPRRPAPALVSSAAAARLWPGQDPIGKRFSRGVEGEGGFEVVGVTSDARTTSLEQTPPLMVYLPYWWRSRAALSLLVRTAAAEPAAVLPAIRRAIASVDPDIAIGRTEPLEQLVEDSAAGRRYQMQLLSAFGAIALLLAALGVYGVTAHGIARRRREINIRVAIGAPPVQVRWMIVRQSGGPVLTGMAAGVAGSLALGRLLSNLLFGVSPADPWVATAGALLMGAVGFAAALIAVRRGLAIDPASALRAE